MPGRQSTGPLAQPGAKPKRRKPKRALDAFAIAEQENPRRNKIRRSRLGETEDQGPKRKRGDDHDDDEEKSNGAATSKRARRDEKDRFGNEMEVGSDSSGNEWVVGQVDEDDDSELDSDEAFGDSDEEKFEGFSFGQLGNPRNKKQRQNRVAEEANGDANFNGFPVDEGNEYQQNEDNESDGFAEDAVDLAGVLDDPASEDDDDDGSNDFSGSSEDESILSISEDESNSGDKEKLASLQALMSTMNEKDVSTSRPRAPVDSQESATPSEYGVNSKRKLTIADLTPSVTDPSLRKSLKILADDNTKASSKRGIAKKLDAPLPQRQQDRINRAAAGEKSKETLSRWIDTVKHNRRADHLIFPLQNPNAVVPPGTKRLLTDNQTQPVTDLEKTIQSILQEKGLAPANGKSEEDQIREFEELAANKMPLAEVQARRAELRRTRELLFREEIRAKRIKKIKSKSFRKVHRKERERNAQQEKDALAEAGLLDDDDGDEKERNDRRRAEERMGARHRESKWAKSVKDSGRAKWDADAKDGVTEMARRNEELRKRIEGREVDGSDDSSIDSDEDDERQLNKLSGHRQAVETDEDPDAGAEGLAGMKFMRRAEAAQKARNDEDAERLRRELAGEETASGDEEDEDAGRRSYGPARNPVNDRPTNPFSTNERSELEEKLGSDDEDESGFQGFEDSTEIITDTSRTPNTTFMDKYHSISNPKSPKQSPKSTLSNDLASNPWLSTSKSPSSKKEKRLEGAGAIISNALPPSDPPPSHAPQSKPRSALKGARAAEKTPPSSSKPDDPNQTSNHDNKANDFSTDSDGDYKNESNTHPLLPSNATLIHRAFAGDSVLASFTAEKEAATQSAAPKEISTTLPGWGSWTGHGLSRKELKRSKSSSSTSKKNGGMTTTPGIVPSQRQDAKLSKVIISQSRVKKNTKYLATQLPFPFETKGQYERSLRLPVGGEWSTKETFQAMTKPRVLRKGGVVAAIEVPAL